MNIIVDANGDRDLIQQLFVTSSVVLRKTKAGEDTLYSETSDSKLQMLKVKNCHPLLKMVRPPKQKQGVKRTNQFICKPCGTSFDSCAKRRKHYLTVDHKPESFAEKKETKKLICRKCSETFITDQDRKAHYYRKHITSSTEAIFKRNKFALLWGEAQLCLPYPKVTYSYPRVTYSDPTHWWQPTLM